MQIGDRVRVKEHVAVALAKRGHNTYSFNWITREGTVKKIQPRGHQIGIQWDDRRSLDWFADHALDVLPEPPAASLGEAGRYGAGKAAAPLDPTAPGRTRRPPLRMKRIRRGSRDVL